MALPKLQEKANIITLDDSQIKAWQDAIQDIVDGSLTEIGKDNAAAQSVYDQLKEMIAGYDAGSFQIGTNNFGQEAPWGK